MAPKKQKSSEPDEVMIVNDSPGEECRIAILQDGHLEELYTERTASATDVGSIYKGRVINVEPAIQAAFIDYGQGVNGFLHISDLHPKYFPGGNGNDRTERVGKKIPRRDRPPIQHALRRGQEILVQVLKEGIGTKGPTLTSYLSIPGRLLVLMPDMDRVGVSRKVEDEEKRREMRQILDSLDLPDGFGFILRTAGYGRTKTELKRDAAYLMRLWKVMEKRIKSVGAPCELYTESDLLIRTMRDVLRPSIRAVVVDSESAYERASMFLRVVAPRSPVKVIRYNRTGPIFHAFDIERQIELIHSREVPLASGGRLVIDQTEALVAIDVNSGRSRSARDSETNAYETNCEAVDEICRQLRLRDLGGLIVNDLIDMRFMKHRRQIEERFQNLLKRDRAKATILPISDFGILEMTRQRMRPSLRKSHFVSCQHCNGRGEIKSPDYVASDAARHIGFLLQYDRVRRVEMVCSARVASVLLSSKRREFVRLEEATGKRIDVRVSDAIAVDRVDYYAYDDRNADIDITKLPPIAPPSIDELAAESVAEAQQPDLEEELPNEEPQRGRRRRRRKHGPADAAAIALAGGFDDDIFDETEDEVEEPSPVASETAGHVVNGEASPGEPRGRRRRRRRRGGGGSGAAPHPQQPHAESSEQALHESDAPSPASPPPAVGVDVAQHASGAATGENGGRRRRRRRRKRRGERPVIEPLQTGSIGFVGDTAESTEIDSPDSDPQAQDSVPVQPIRIHELARELNITSRELIDRCEPEPSIHHVANALATVTADEAEAIRQMFSNGEHPLQDEHPAETGSSHEAQALEAHEDHQAASNRESTSRDGNKSRRSRRRNRRRHAAGASAAQPAHHAEPDLILLHEPAAAPQIPAAVAELTAAAVSSDQTVVPPLRESRRSRRRRKPRRTEHAQAAASTATIGTGSHVIQSSAAQSKPQSQGQAPAPSTGSVSQGDSPSQTSAENSNRVKKPRRALYRAGRGPVSAAAREGIAQDE